MLSKLLRTTLICGIFLFNNYGLANANEFGPFRGKIVDANTKEPIEGVVVLIEWRKLHFFAGSTFIDAQETLTDKNGEFYIPGIWIFDPWKRLMSEASMIIYKSEYQAISTGAWRDWEGFKPPLKYVERVENGNPVIVLIKLSLTARKESFTPGWEGIPSEKAKLLIQEINKEGKFLGLGEVGPVRREK